MEPTNLSHPQTEERWRRAFQNLRERDKDLADTLRPPEASQPNSLSEYVNKVVQEKLEASQLKKWRISIRGKSILLRDQYEKIVRFVLWSKDLISQGCAASPYASLAWSGAAMMLPLLLRPSEQSDAMATGLSEIVDIIKLYAIRDGLYSIDHSEEWKNFGDAVVDLYSKVLEYQAQVIRHLSHSSLHRLGSSIKQSFNWTAWLKDIMDIEAQCRRFSDLFDKKREREVMNRQADILQRSTSVQQQLLDLFADSLQKDVDTKRDDREMQLLHSFAENLPYEDQKNTRRLPIDGTCRWILDVDSFQNWRYADESSLLWLSAGPGCGKSVLSRFLIDQQHLQRSVTTTHVSYFFFRAGNENFQEGASPIRAILHQIFSTHLERDSLLPLAASEYKSKGSALRSNLASLWRILLAVADHSDAGTIVCAIDALDECTHERDQLIQLIVDYYGTPRRHGQRSNLKMLITSRRYDFIERGFMRVADLIEIDGNKYHEQIEEDIDKVLIHEVEESFFGGSQRVKSLVQENLRTAPNKTYLWLFLVLDYLKKTCKGARSKQVQQALREAPKTVDEAYQEILARQASNTSLATSILMIVVAAQYPLNTRELNVALALSDIDSVDEIQGADDIEVYDEQTIRSKIENACGLLVQIFDDQVYLLHQTVQTFLLRDEKEAQPPQGTWKGVFSTHEAHELITRVSMHCLLLQQPKYISCHEKCQIFVQYAGHHWTAHYRKMSLSCQRSLLDACEILFDHAENWIERTPYRTLKGDNPIFQAIYLGLFHLVERFLGKPGTDVNRSVINEANTLFQATAFGYYDIVQLLLDKGADVNVNGSSQALVGASKSGFIDVVQLLLSKGADVNAGPPYGRIALIEATKGGHIDVVQLLLNKGADVNAGPPYGKTALAEASESGYMDIVQLLLSKGADVNTVSQYGGNALIPASRNGHIDIVQLLLDKGADVNTVHYYERTALVNASEYGHIDVIQLLLNRGADVNAASYRKTALMTASHCGHVDVIELLLDKGANINIGTPFGTALSSACSSGNEYVVTLLLDRGADINIVSSTGSALSEACSYGHQNIVELLLNRGADIDITSSAGTALGAACAKGRENIVKLLLDKGADIDIVLDKGTALVEATSCRHQNIVELLLERGADINIVSSIGSALEMACVSEREHLVKLLLDRGADVNTLINGHYLLRRAACRRRSRKVVRLLLEYGADISSRDIHFIRAFSKDSRDDLQLCSVRDIVHSDWYDNDDEDSYDEDNYDEDNYDEDNYDEDNYDEDNYDEDNYDEGSDVDASFFFYEKLEKYAQVCHCEGRTSRRHSASDLLVKQDWPSD